MPLFFIPTSAVVLLRFEERQRPYTLVMKEEKVQFPSSKGHLLSGNLSHPETTSKDVVLLLHGGMAHKDSFYHKTLATTVCDELHCSVFRFDFSGNGSSFPLPKEDGEQTQNMMAGFWDDVADVELARLMLFEKCNLRLVSIVGHSRGGQVAHMYSVKHGYPDVSIVGVNMRYNLQHWRKTWQKQLAENGENVYRWKSRGKSMYHRVSEEDVNCYADVEMYKVSSIVAPVMNVYGIKTDNRAEADYDVGGKLLVDGVVPFDDVAEVANRVVNHKLCFLPNVGHYLREDGAWEKLWSVLKPFLAASMSDSKL